MRRITLLAVMFAAAALGQLVVPGGGSGGGGAGSGTVTSIDASGGVQTVSGSAITDSGTVRAYLPVNAQTGTSYTIQNSDRGKTITCSNGSAVAITLPQAGATFPDGWFAFLKNIGAADCTVTPITSTISGAASIVVSTGEYCLIRSDGTNYEAYCNRVTSGTGITLTKSRTGVAPAVDSAAVMLLAGAQEATGLKSFSAGVDLSASAVSQEGACRYDDTANALKCHDGSGEVAQATTVTTTRGDLIRRGASADERVALGSSGTVVCSDGTDAVWCTPTAANITNAFDKTADAQTKSITLFDPVTGDSGRVQFYFGGAVTITRVACSVKAATSATINLEERAEATPDTSGTAVLTSNLVCDTDSAASTTFSNAGIAARVPLALTITAVSGTPDTLRVHIEYTID